MPLAHALAAAPDRTALRRDAALALACAALALLAAAVAARPLAGFGAWYAPKALVLFGLGAACVWQGLAGHAPHRRFGLANALTLARLAMAALLAAALGEPLAERPALAWAAVLLATLTAVLDAVDGPLARARGQASAFGARFDMETDALLILVLSALVLQLGKAGAWVLAAGGMRYAFVLAGRLWPWLDAPLPPSWRRKTVCVVQITALIVCLGPVIPPDWSGVLAAASLALLAWSFAVDTAWLARRHATEVHP
jgi:phosphatidylglycerophosphate synthase